MFRINQDESEKSEDKIVVSHRRHTRGGFGNTCETIWNLSSGRPISFMKILTKKDRLIWVVL